MNILYEISEIYGIEMNQIHKINDGFQNSVYCNSATDLIIRISAADKRSHEELKSELIYITGLAQNGLNVSAPVLSINGHFIEEIKDDNQTYFVTAFEKANGFPVNVTETAVWNEDLFFQWGKFIGKMHCLSKEFEGVRRPAWSYEKPDLFNLLPKIDSELIANRYIKLLESIKSFKKNPEVFGLIHNDLHQGNFFVYAGKITLFDFDDCAYNWFAYDLAVSYYHAYWQSSTFTPDNTQFSDVFWSHFLKGYKLEHTLQKELIEQIPIMLKIREIFLYVLFLEKWEMKEEWQVYTVNDLKYKIENDIPYSNTNFQEIIDSIA